MIPARRLMLVALLLLVARVLLALGPEGTVLCVHDDGSVFVESTAELCCARAECASGRTPSAAEAPQAPDDGCQDYALSTGAPLIAHEPGVSVDLRPAIALATVIDPLESLSLVALDHAVTRGIDADEVEPPPPRTVVLRC